MSLRTSATDASLSFTDLLQPTGLVAPLSPSCAVQGGTLGMALSQVCHLRPRGCAVPPAVASFNQVLWQVQATLLNKPATGCTRERRIPVCGGFLQKVPRQQETPTCHWTPHVQIGLFKFFFFFLNPASRPQTIYYVRHGARNDQGDLWLWATWNWMKRLELAEVSFKFGFCSR